MKPVPTFSMFACVFTWCCVAVETWFLTPVQWCSGKSHMWFFRGDISAVSWRCRWKEGKEEEGRRRRGRKKNRWLDETQAWTGHVTGGVPWNFLLALPLCRSSWCHYSHRLREFETPSEQIGQSARIIRRKLSLISHRLPRPHSHTLSLFLSSPPRRLLLKTVSREGRGFRKHVIMSSVPKQWYPPIWGRDTYSYIIMLQSFWPSSTDMTPWKPSVQVLEEPELLLLLKSTLLSSC